jgi:hypothetical protein
MKIERLLTEETGLAMAVGLTIGIGGYLINGFKSIIFIPLRVKELEQAHKSCEDRERKLERSFETWKATTTVEISKLSGKLEVIRTKLERVTKEKEKLTDELLRSTGGFAAVEPYDDDL